LPSPHAAKVPAFNRYNKETTMMKSKNLLLAVIPCIAALSGCSANPDQNLASATLADTAPPPGTKPPVSPGNGLVPGVPLANGGALYYCKDALLSNFEWFDRLKGWFPSVLHTSYALTPTHQVVDMAYASSGTMSFKNVVVPVDGTYKITFRYAFASGLFGGIKDRPMGISVNGTVVTDEMHFPITGSFSVYQESSIPVQLTAGTNAIDMFNVSDHGVSRLDTMTVTPTP
jgi:hypothetical protein